MTHELTATTLTDLSVLVSHPTWRGFALHSLVIAAVYRCGVRSLRLPRGLRETSCPRWTHDAAGLIYAGPHRRHDTAAPGNVDGAWWPWSTDPAMEFPALVMALSSWVGPARHVA
ncbi:DUF5994 family protein [Actinosynnema sp. ALI-1.44]|uniref:DUF5994 family protein n=1 Tax=Actinosynnema sp. ALI-1.44 TaxID=1933779 RepID=UPI001EDB39B0|nr:DUF5994 family protein [Actinosynnema sp. ALI-1.44]